MKKYWYFLYVAFALLPSTIRAGSHFSVPEDHAENMQEAIVLRRAGKQLLQETPDPAADLILQPFKGETLWIEEKEAQASWMGRAGKRTFSYPKVTEFTLAYPPSKKDIRVVEKGLEAYDREKIGKVNLKTVIISVQGKDTPPLFAGLLLQDSLFLESSGENLLLRPEIFLSALRKIEGHAHINKMQGLYLIVPSPLVPFRNLYREEGLRFCGSYTDYEDGIRKCLYYKQTALMNPKEESQTSPAITMTFIAGNNEDTVVSPETYGIFMRTPYKVSIKGGVLATLNRNDYIPCSFIETLWVNEKYRGRSFGKQLLSSAEEFIRKEGIFAVELTTADHQAPRFYEKMGYSLDMTYPNLWRLLDGHRANAYLFHKNLKEK